MYHNLMNFYMIFTMRIFLLISFVLAIVFVVHPELDLQVSHLFYTQSDGFFLKKNPIVIFLFRMIPVLVGVIMAGLGALVIAINVKKRKFFGLGNKEIAYLFLAFVLGPGLIVNTVFKEHWGRARPSQVTEFGGDKHFSPAFIISDQCTHNCSFISGHASVAFYLIAFGLILQRWRRPVISMAVMYGIIIGLVRIMQGGHFLSDVLFSGVFTSLSVIWLYGVMYKDKVACHPKSLS
jgi:lipid A 4'-phosphatase